jgi:serine/threonine-protein kinase
MSTNTRLNAESFIGLVKQSNLVDPDLLKKTWRELTDRALDLDDARIIADELVQRNVLTRWQADKLLQRKHKGFFLGKYRLLSHLGSGGMSAVYLAEHVLMRRRVAIKVLPQARVADTSYLQRFHREAQAVAALDHRNIVRAYDVDQEGKVHFLVMEFVAGQSLHDLTMKSGRLEFVEAAEYIRQVAEGLQHAHRMGMVHRDIKPGNLLLDEKGTIKLLDLGLARFFDEKEENSLTIQHDEKVLGTADFLSPEQALDSHKVDSRSDIYSLGCTLYFLLAGHPPFPEGTLAQRLLAHQTKQPESIRGIRANIPEGLLAILEKAMAKKPGDRYQTANEMADSLLQWLTGHGGEAWSRMNPMLANGSSILSAAPSSSGVLESDTVSPNRTQGSVPTEIGPRSTPGPGGNPAAPKKPESTRPPAASDPATNSIQTELEKYRIVVSDNDEISSRKKGSGINRDAARTGASSGRSSSDRLVEPDDQSPTISLPPGIRELSSLVDEAPLIVQTPPAPVASAPANRPIDGSVPLTVVAPLPKPTGSERPVRASKGASESAPAAPKSAARSAAANAQAAPRRFDRRLIAGGGAAIALLVAVAGYLAIGGSTKSGAGGTGQGSSSESEPGKAKRSPSAPLKRELTVGPGGQFRTITAALEDTKLHVNKSRRAVQTIKVAAGQVYPEQLVIDSTFPRGIHIVAEEGAAPVLAPPGEKPIVILGGGKEQLENFLLEGFQLDARGKEVAVQVAGWIPGMRLHRLEIRGFSRCGLLLDGVQTFGAENDRILLEKLTFRDAGPQATGVLFQRKQEDAAHIRIQQCRFFGPLDVGIQVDSGVIDLEILESLFVQMQTGIRLAGAGRTWRDVLLAFNTFYENDRGLVFSHMPSPSSSGFGFHNNLFFGSKAADAVIEQGFNLQQFLATLGTIPGGVGYNWTTRPKPNPAPPGELLNLFDTAPGRFAAADLRFQSVDPMNAAFLAPAEGSPQRKVGTFLDRRRFGEQIGAIRPQ